jgi:hypothetical protein
MSGEKRVEKLRRVPLNNFQRGQRNVIPAYDDELEAKGEHSYVSNDDLDLSFFDNPYIKILIRLGRHQPHCSLF